MRDTTIDQARGNQRIRIDVAEAERLVVRVDDHADLARLELREWRALYVDLVGNHPQVPGTQTRVFVALQIQRRISDLLRHASPCDRRSVKVAHRRHARGYT